VKDLHQYMSYKFLNPFVNSYIEYRQSSFLHDPEKRGEINEDLIFIAKKIYLRFTLKILVIVFQIMFIVYFIGQYWFIIVEIGCMFRDNFNQNDESLSYNSGISEL
jgi:hypothetical protein